MLLIPAHGILLYRKHYRRISSNRTLLDTSLHQILGSDGARGHGYLLGAIEIPQYGKRQPIRLNLEAHPGALAVLGTVPERTAIINALIAQAIARQNPVYVLTSDAGYHRRLHSYADSLAVLVGPHEPQHLRFCLEKNTFEPSFC